MEEDGGRLGAVVRGVVGSFSFLPRRFLGVAFVLGGWGGVMYSGEEADERGERGG